MLDAVIKICSGISFSACYNIPVSMVTEIELFVLVWLSRLV